MTQADRDRLVTLQKTRKGLITQGEAAGEWDLSLRQVQRLLAASEGELATTPSAPPRRDSIQQN